MKPKYSIGLFIFIILVVYFIAVTLPDNNDSKEEISISTDGEILNKECYYLYDTNGYISVYLWDNKTVYEYTDIPVEYLPETLRTELKHGKYIESKEELYGFLENYSS